MSQENTSPISSNMSNDSDPLNNQLSQKQLITLLQTTITKLDVIVSHLNEQTIETLPSQEILTTLINSTNSIANSLESQSEASTSVISDTEVLEDTEIVEDTEEWEENVEKSDYIPNIDRGKNPEDIENKQAIETKKPGKNIFPKWGIIGGVSFILIGVLSASFFFFQPSLPNFEIPQIISESSQSEVLETPPQLEIQELPQPIENVPPPQPKLTPEQNLIAAIQKEVSALTHQYSEDLIRKVEANFLSSRLIVTIGEEWYSLSTQEQDNLATNMLERAKSLDFRKLELVNAKGGLIARSPVVGNNVIILQRHPE